MKPTAGIFYALAAAACYGLMSFLVHWNPQRFPVEQLTFIRGVVTFCGLLPFCYRELGTYFARGSLALWLRAVTGAVGAILYFYTLQGTVSANANFLFSSSPVFVTLFSWAYLRERLTRREALGIALIVGANLLLYWPNRATMAPWVWAVGLGGAVVSSVAYLSLGAAARKHSSTLIVVGFAAVTTLLAAALPGETWLATQPVDFGFLLAVGALGLLSQILTTFSFVHLKSSIATALGRTSILCSALLDITLAGYKPHWLEWTSYMIVILAVALTRQQQFKPKAL